MREMGRGAWWPAVEADRAVSDGDGGRPGVSMVLYLLFPSSSLPPSPSLSLSLYLSLSLSTSLSGSWAKGVHGNARTSNGQAAAHGGRSARGQAATPLPRPPRPPPCADIPFHFHLFPSPSTSTPPLPPPSPPHPGVPPSASPARLSTGTAAHRPSPSTSISSPSPSTSALPHPLHLTTHDLLPVHERHRVPTAFPIHLRLPSPIPSTSMHAAMRADGQPAPHATAHCPSPRRAMHAAAH